MSKQQQFSELLGQRLTAAHQETADDLMWQQLQQRLNNKRGKSAFWLSSAASLAMIGVIGGMLYSNQPEPAQVAIDQPQTSPVSNFRLEQLDAAIQQSILLNDYEQVERLIVQRQEFNEPQPRTYTL